MSISMYDLLVNPLGWDKDFYRFDRFEKDMNPYSIKYNKEEGKAILSHNILGIDKKDLSIAIKPENGRNYLVISGKTVDEVTGKEYSINSRFYISEDYDTDKIEAEAKNGLVYITIPYKKEVLKDKTKTINVK
ncbi:MAG: Hsp20/alpha crystallin family protein [Clostridia bacterium]